MEARYGSIGRTFNISFALADLPVSDQRDIFNTLFMDPKVNPGSETMSREDAAKLLTLLTAWCGWNSEKKGA